MRGLLLAALTEAAIISWRDISADKVLPMPSDYAAVAIFYGGLGLLPPAAEGFASLVGWGIVLATLLNLWDPAHPTKLDFPQANPQQVAGGPQTAGANAAASVSTAIPTQAVPQGQPGGVFSTPNPLGGFYPVKAQ